MDLSEVLSEGLFACKFKIDYIYLQAFVWSCCIETAAAVIWVLQLQGFRLSETQTVFIIDTLAKN